MVDFTQIDYAGLGTDTEPNWFSDYCVLGDYVVIAIENITDSALLVFRINADGTITYITEFRNYSSFRFNYLATDGTYVFASASAAGLCAFSFDGSTLSHIYTYPQANFNQNGRIIYANGYIFGTNNSDELCAYSFNGSTISLVANSAVVISHDWYLFFWIDDRLVFLNGVYNLTFNVLSFNGTSFNTEYSGAIADHSISRFAASSLLNIFINDTLYEYSGGTLNLLGAFEPTPSWGFYYFSGYFDKYHNTVLLNPIFMNPPNNGLAVKNSDGLIDYGIYTSHPLAINAAFIHGDYLILFTAENGVSSGTDEELGLIDGQYVIMSGTFFYGEDPDAGVEYTRTVTVERDDFTFNAATGRFGASFSGTTLGAIVVLLTMKRKSLTTVNGIPVYPGDWFFDPEKGSNLYEETMMRPDIIKRIESGVKTALKPVEKYLTDLKINVTRDMTNRNRINVALDITEKNDNKLDYTFFVEVT